MSGLRFAILAAVFTVIASACSGGGPPPGAPDSYVALVPRVFRAGETETVSLSLFDGPRLTSGNVSVSLLKDGKPLVQGVAQIDGKGTVQLNVPPDTKGEYDLVVEGPGFKEQGAVQVQSGTLLFVETDKPIYKPGQTVHIRAVTLNSELKPLPVTATLEVSDARGIKVFKQDVTADEFGMATLDLPLSTEPNLGVWKITATAGDTATEVDVRVEEYVLPKYEVSVEMAKDWFLVNEPIKGHVKATYSFGKPVNGDLKITAARYVGEWEQFATISTTVTDGEGDFEVQAPDYVAGVPEAGGKGNVQLDFVLTEKNTGYEEKTTELVTVAASPVTVQLIPETPSFKPGLPFNVMIVTETPDGQPVESNVSVDLTYFDDQYQASGQETRTVKTVRGVGILALTPPDRAAQLSLNANTGDAYAFKQVTAAYSPSGNFIHVVQEEPTELKAGSRAHFSVLSTSEARNFYYEVVARDRVVFTSSVDSPDITLEVTPAMTGGAKLLVYQILPTSEVAADFIPFDVQAAYPEQVTAAFSEKESKPGDRLSVDVQTEGRAKVGLVAVDRSVFILAENRLNLQQVFDEIERLYQQPQAELHEGDFFQPGPVIIPGASQTFEDAGLMVMTNKEVPDGKKLESPARFGLDAMGVAGAGGPVEQAPNADAFFPIPAPARSDGKVAAGGLAEVQRVRQFFPETWIWDTITTGGDGKGTLAVTAPDTITTWDLRAVAISPDKGLGVAETEMRVFQPFFLSADLPYSAIRGEEFPLKVALYNYTDSQQEFQVDIEGQPWFDLLDSAAKTITVGPNDTGGVEFKIRPTGVGTQTVKVTARGADAADGVIKSIIVEPEGVQREQVANGVLTPGSTKNIDLPLPVGAVPDSQRAYVAITGSLLAQTIDGLDQLLAMPYGCGEQNMLLFAPDAYILKYLKGTSQLKPEIQAKAETLLITGYQRELTYRRSDGSFSAFGDNDESGSLFLTAFVLKTFAQAKGLIYVDDAVLADAAKFISAHQNADGSFQDVGFVHHYELMGGVQGRDALTAYAATAMLEAGQGDSASKAIAYLEGRIDDLDDDYSLALVTYTLEMAKSPKASAAYDKLIARAQEDDDSLHWASPMPEPLPLAGGRPQFQPPFPGQMGDTSGIETTAYGVLALTAHGDPINAGRAAKWLVAHRNSQGGFGSTQDTVVALQALTQFAASAASDTDMTVTVRAGDISKDVRITPDNFDVTQMVDVPPGVPVAIEAQGKGQGVYQAVTRYNLPAAEEQQKVFDIKVDFNTTDVAVNDTVGVDVSVKFNGPGVAPTADQAPVKAGMVVLDVALPTGFAPVTESLDRLAAANPKIKRYDVAGRKVILYIEDMTAGETLNFRFDVKAQYPVRAKGPASQAYSYYTPEWRGETIGQDVTVR